MLLYQRGRAPPGRRPSAGRRKVGQKVVGKVRDVDLRIAVKIAASPGYTRSGKASEKELEVCNINRSVYRRHMIQIIGITA